MNNALVQQRSWQAETHQDWISFFSPSQRSEVSNEALWEISIAEMVGRNDLLFTCLLPGCKKSQGHNKPPKESGYPGEHGSLDGNPSKKDLYLFAS